MADMTDEERAELQAEIDADKKRKSANAKRYQSTEKGKAARARFKAKKIKYVKNKKVIKAWLDKTREQRNERNRLRWGTEPGYKQARMKANRRWVVSDKEKKAGRPKPKQCEVCSREGRIMFDHCHKSSIFRGWICLNCNVILGLVDDSPELLEQLASYLRTHDYAKQGAN
jgi:hypothetical protein